MFIVFRVDASTQIGTGHVIRCLTLADALRAAGHEVKFVCRRHDGHLGSVIEQHGYRVTLLEPYHDFTGNPLLAHADWLGTSWHDDAEDIIALLLGRQADWLIIDHYALDIDWQRELRPYCKHIMVIDDLADRTHDADLLLDQNFHLDMRLRYSHHVDDDTSLLLGPDYCMLRNEFTDLKDDVRLRTSLDKVLVFFGGVDIHNLTSLAIDALVSIEGVDITVITGNRNPHADEIMARCADETNVECHRHVDNIAELMLRADLAIGAGGTTSWERCYLGLPSITVTIADNQLEINRGLQSIGACVHLGEYYDVTSSHIHDTIHLLKDKPFLLKDQSRNCINLMRNHVGTGYIVHELERLL